MLWFFKGNGLTCTLICKFFIFSFVGAYSETNRWERFVFPIYTETWRRGFSKVGRNQNMLDTDIKVLYMYNNCIHVFIFSWS